MPRIYIYLIAFAALSGGVAWFSHVRYEAGEDAGKAKVQALWDADKKALSETNAKILAEAAAREKAAQVKNTEVLRDTNAQLVAIAADRDSLADRMRDYQDRIRRLAASAATSERGVDVAAGIASRAQEAERAVRQQYDRYDVSCQRDAVRFQALQDQIRPQLAPTTTR